MVSAALSGWPRQLRAQMSKLWTSLHPFVHHPEKGFLNDNLPVPPPLDTMLADDNSDLSLDYTSLVDFPIEYESQSLGKER